MIIMRMESKRKRRQELHALVDQYLRDGGTISHDRGSKVLVLCVYGLSEIRRGRIRPHLR